MSRNRFIHLVRAYVREARRGKRTYGAQVNALAKMYMNAVSRIGGTQDDYDKELEWAKRFVEREYGSADKEFIYSLSD